MPLRSHITSPGNNESLTVILSRLHCSQVPEILTAQHHKTLSSKASNHSGQKGTQSPSQMRTRQMQLCLGPVLIRLFKLQMTSIMLSKGLWFGGQKS